MTTPPKYEDLVLKVAELERRESDLMEKIARAGRVSFTFFEERDAALAREAALRKELDIATRHLDRMIEAHDDAQQRVETLTAFAQQIARQQGEPYFSKLAKAALKPAAEGEGS